MAMLNKIYKDINKIENQIYCRKSKIRDFDCSDPSIFSSNSAKWALASISEIFFLKVLRDSSFSS